MKFGKNMKIMLE